MNAPPAQVQGYVKSASKAGVFVALSGALDARVQLSNLAEGFVADPEAAFPVGKLVQGRILAISPDKCALTSSTPTSLHHHLDDIV